MSVIQATMTGGQFVINQPSALAACSAAQQALGNDDQQGAEAALLEALRSRPSCALAFKLLGDLFHRAGDEQAAGQCRRNLLPESLLSQHFHNADVPSGLAAQFNRSPVFASAEHLIPAVRGIRTHNTFVEQILNSAPGFVDRIRDATVWHDDINTVVFDQSGGELTEHTVGSAAMLRALCQQHEPLHVDGRAILLGAKGAHNYYHWCLDIIPKIGMLREAGIDLRASDTYIVARADAQFTRQLLGLFGIEPTQIVATETTSPFIRADELLVPYLQNKMGYTMHTWVPEFMRSAMGVQDRQSRNSKLFIDRNATTSAGRTLGNSAEIRALFVKRGFEVVYPETLSVAQQAALFASADVVAGVHGAGLSNIVYCGPGTKIIEFFGAHIAPCYWIISGLCGLQYYHHRVEQSDGGGHAAGFDLPPAEAQAVLACAGVG